MGSDHHEPGSPAEQPAADSTAQPAADPAAQPAADPAEEAGKPTAAEPTADVQAADVQTAGEQTAGEQPVDDGHSEQWRANASRAGEMIKGMFKS